MKLIVWRITLDRIRDGGKFSGTRKGLAGSGRPGAVGQSLREFSIERLTTGKLCNIIIIIIVFPSNQNVISITIFSSDKRKIGVKLLVLH